MSTATSQPSGLTDWQRQQRRERLTASDVAAWMGFNPFKTAADVFLEKTGRVPESESSDAAEAGLDAEPGTLAWAERKLETRLRRNQWRTGQHPVLGATCDAVTVESGRVPAGTPIEAKAVGLLNYKALNMAEWGDDESDIVPDRFLIQVTAQMYVTGAEVGVVAALLAGYGRRIYFIERHPDIVDGILRAADDFARCIKADTPPANSTPSLEVIQSARRASGRCVTVSDDVAAAFVTAKANRKAAEEVEEAARAELLAAMRHADGEYVEDARWTGGTITYRQNKPSRKVDHAAMVAAHPVIAKQYEREYPGARVLRVREGGGK